MPIPYSLRKLGPKFANALRGLQVAVRGQNGFGYHGVALVAVVVISTLVGVSRLEWLAIMLCVTIVISTELMNTALEHLARAVTHDEHPEVRNALDVAAGSVLVASIGAKLVWVAILSHHLLGMG